MKDLVRIRRLRRVWHSWSSKVLRTGVCRLYAYADALRGIWGSLRDRGRFLGILTCQAQRLAFFEKSVRDLEAERRVDVWELDSISNMFELDRGPTLCRSALLVRATVAEEQLKQLQKHLKAKQNSRCTGYCARVCHRKSPRIIRCRFSI